MLSELNGSAGVKRRRSVAPARATLEVGSELRSDPYPQCRTLGQGSTPGEGLLAASMYPLYPLLGLQYKVPSAGRLKMTQIDSLTVLEARSPR